MSTNWNRIHQRLWRTTSRILGEVPVVIGALQTSGMFDEKSELVLDGQAISIENALTGFTSELGGLRYGDPITVNDVPYTVRAEPLRIGDGMLCVLSLERKEPSVALGVYVFNVFEPGVFA